MTQTTSTKILFGIDFYLTAAELVAVKIDDQVMQLILPDRQKYVDTVTEICGTLSNREVARCEIKLGTEKEHVKSFRVNYPNTEGGSFLETGVDETGVYLLLDKRLSPTD